MEPTYDEILQTDTEDGVVVKTFLPVSVCDEQDVLSALQALAREVSIERYSRLVLDLSGVDYLSSAALGAIVGLYKRVTQSGGQLRLCGVNDQITELFQVMRLDTVLSLSGDRVGALTDSWA